MGRAKIPVEFKRTKTSIALRPVAWAEFRDTCHQLGQSASGQIETLMGAWLRRQKNRKR